MHPNSTPLEHRELGVTTIDVTDDEFMSGFQVGKLLFRTRSQEPLTDQALYSFLQDTLHKGTTDHYKAGAISGWFAALYGYRLPTPALMFEHQEGRRC